MSFHERRGGRHGRGWGRGSGSSRGGSGKGKRPSHIPEGLRGKEIGLYFARRGRARKVWADRHQKVAVSIDYQTQRELKQLIRCISLEEGPSHKRLESINTVAVDYLSNAPSCFDPENGVVKLKIERDTALDEKLCQNMQAKAQLREYQNMLDFRKKLPAYTMREEIIELIERNRVVVISGETGSGKTTQVPQFILDSYIEKGLGSLCKIICTQPRRISAISVAERVAAERAERCGESAGYQIRLECRAPRDRGSILFCTTGILLQQLQSDPYIVSASHVILDEVHERDLQTDFLSIILKDLLVVRPDLCVILMSATINAEMFSEYFGNCPRLEIPGITFPVDVIYLEDILEHTGYRGNSLFDGTSAVGRKDRRKFEESIEDIMPFIRSLEGKYSNKTLGTLSEWNEMRIDLDLVHALISEICAKKPEGAILVFLPGWEQINDLNKLLTADRYLRGSLIIPLHSMMPTVNQRQVFDRPPAGVRKIVLATNIAETSITINDVVYVIDCGKIKMSNFDVDKNLATLNAEWVSRANAQQRKGRAGRVQPGVCYRLYTSWRESQLEAYQLPEMLRTRLETLILKIKILKLGSAEAFLQKAINPPSSEALHLSLQFLITLKALNEDETLTPLGYHLAKLPLDPQTGKMIIMASIFSCLDPILTVAASLSFKDAFMVPLGKEKLVEKVKKQFAGDSKSDHIMLVNVFSQWEEAVRHRNGNQFCYENFLSWNTLKMLSNMRQQFAEYLQELNFMNSKNIKARELNQNSDNLKVLQAVICAGLYPNVAKGSFNKSKRLMRCSTKTDAKTSLHPKSVNVGENGFDTQWFVYYTKIRSTRTFLHDITPVYPIPLLLFGGFFKHSGDTITLDDWITIHCDYDLAELVQDLRQEFDRILEKKITAPGLEAGTMSPNQRRLLSAIIGVLSRETTDVPEVPDYFDDDDDADVPGIDET
nr:LOW QUALITY PROTEIN: ATP-dependent DNA/RNA helicase DHX36-like [Rhipicephalus microplus]